MGIREKVEVLKNKIRKNPRNYRAYSDLGVLYRRSGNLNGSIQAYQRSIKINSRVPHTLNGYGESLWMAKRYPEALKVFKKALKIDRNFPLTHMNLGKAFSLVGNKTRAVLHTRYAEKIYLNNKDHKGVIEAKKQLRLLLSRENL